MLRRFGLPLVLAVAGFVAGIAVTGRGRAAEMFRANDTPRAVETAGAQRPAPAPATAPSAPAFSTGRPDSPPRPGQPLHGVGPTSPPPVARRGHSPVADGPRIR